MLHHYKVLGVPCDADIDTIKKAFKKLAKIWHPDKYRGNNKEAAHEKFIQIRSAHDYLIKITK